MALVPVQAMEALPEAQQALEARRAEVQEALMQPLDREEISLRDGGGGSKVAYIEGWRVLDKANRIFGCEGWNSRIVEITKELEEQNEKSGRWTVLYSSVVRVELREWGTYHEDVGTGLVQNEKDRGKAIENARKAAVTDGVKRALRNFGAALGNSVYDKQHVKAATKRPCAVPPGTNKRPAVAGAAGPSAPQPAPRPPLQPAAQQQYQPPPAAPPRPCAPPQGAAPAQWQPQPMQPPAQPPPMHLQQPMAQRAPSPAGPSPDVPLAHAFDDAALMAMNCP